MSVYDCEPPQLDLPTLDEEITKRREHENEFDLEDEELSSYSMNLNNEHSAITNNVLHLYDSSPPPVDDYYIRNDDYEDDLEIPPDDNESDSAEKFKKSIIENDEDFNQIDIPSLDTTNYTSPKIYEINEKDNVEPQSSSLEYVTNSETVSMSKVEELEENFDVGVTSINDGPKNEKNDILADNKFILEDLPEEDNENENNKTNVNNFTQKSDVQPENISDDDFDDSFNDFEQAIPIDRHIEHPIQIEDKQNEPNEIQFDADFSAFEANFDNEFQNFSTSEDQEKSETKEMYHKNENFDAEEDDDFGDFNDFTQGQTQEAPIEVLPNEQSLDYEHHTLTILSDSEVKTILGEMFPVDQKEADEENFTTYSIASTKDGVEIVNDVESTLALSYEYKDSSTSHILIKALGIDERNILFGQQWGSSNMPRFASDLSFNPLEPAKFSSSSTSSFKSNSSSANNSTVTSHKVKENELENLKDTPPHPQQPQQQPDIVPEFDWNVAGLINPLDGKQVNALKPNERERDDPPIQYDLSVFDNIPQKNSEILSPDVDNGLSNKHVWQNDRFDVTNSTVVRERTIKLPETHIFTPIKSISPVAREVSRETSPIDNIEKDKRSVIIKEYHDVEYSLEPSKKSDNIENDFGDFNDFQSAPNNHPVMLLPTSTSILAPQKPTESSININNKLPETTNSTTMVDDFEPFVTNNVKSIPSQPIQPSLNSNLTKYDVFSELSKTVKDSNIKSIEDDFADFQAAPTIAPQKSIIEKSHYRGDTSITLSPSRLVSNMKNLSESSQPNNLSMKMSAWNETLDSDEISRIEAAFPKCKIDSNKKKNAQQFIDVNTASTKDDDEWCDFQSVCQSSNIASSNNNSHNLIPNHTTSTKGITNSDNMSSDTSDWSEFVSVPVAKPSISTSQFLSKPNFSSWNQPVGKPFVNHTTSFLSSNNNYPQNSQFDESFYTSMSVNDRRNGQPMTITNNFNYNNFERQDISSSTIPPYQMPNGISTILPDLQFALPKTLVNLSRGNGSDTTKK